MADKICFTVAEAWEESISLVVQAHSQVACAVSRVTVSLPALQELRGEIQAFLQEGDLETYWESDIPGLGLTPCITMKWIPDASRDHVLLDLYMELDDGGDFSRHTCSFYIHCTRDQLKKFSEMLRKTNLMINGMSFSLEGI